MSNPNQPALFPEESPEPAFDVDAFTGRIATSAALHAPIPEKPASAAFTDLGYSDGAQLDRTIVSTTPVKSVRKEDSVNPGFELGFDPDEPVRKAAREASQVHSQVHDSLAFPRGGNTVPTEEARAAALRARTARLAKER